MSWAEIMKINNNLTDSLNVQYRVQHIQLIGGSGLSMNITDISDYVSLFRSNCLYANPLALQIVSYQFWEMCYYAGSGVGNAINNAFNLGNATLAAKTTLVAVGNDDTMALIINMNEKCARSLACHPASLATIMTISSAYAETFATGIRPYVWALENMCASKVCIDAIMANTNARAIIKANPQALTTVGSGTFTGNQNRPIIVQIIGGGMTGEGDGTNRPGGNAGAVVSRAFASAAGAVFNYTIGGGNADTIFNGVVSRAGAGAPSETNAAQSGCFVLASACGGTGTGGSPGKGGGGGYGGGNGTAGGTSNDSRGSGGAAGIGSAEIGSGGGGGGGQGNSSSSSTAPAGGGGGGGYGGGGGGGQRTGGAGGAGAIVVYR